MTIHIPSVLGVPGIHEPPNWLTAPPSVNLNLDDVRWRGATKRTHGGGSSQSASFHAIHAIERVKTYLYLSFRAAFVPGLSDQNDTVYIGLQSNVASAQAMVIRVRIHGTPPIWSGPPPAQPPAVPFEVQIFTPAPTAANVAWNPLPSATPTPTWIDNSARVWLQKKVAPPGVPDVPMDNNNRWTLQLRVPVKSAGGITDNDGPNLGTDFKLWYAITGTDAMQAPIVLTNNATVGVLTNARFPLPANWEQAILGNGPNSGGIAIDWSDIGTSDGVNINLTSDIANSMKNGVPTGATNIFVARPKNYSTSPIPAGAINATFRYANWGSVNGNTDFSSGSWEYVPGSGPLIPKPSGFEIPVLPTPPPQSERNSIALSNVSITLGPNKSRHQCMLVTLSGTNLNFLNDSVVRNMDFDHASLLSREAEISLVGLKPISPQPRDVYLAVERVNMLRNNPAGYSEGRFLEASMKRVIDKGGSLAESLQAVQAQLSDGDGGSAYKLRAILSALRQAADTLKYSDPAQGKVALNNLVETLQGWLSAVKSNEASAKRLAGVMTALANWLNAEGADALVKLTAFIQQFSQWLAGLNEDPESAQWAPQVAQSLRFWLSSLSENTKLTTAIETIEVWLNSGQSPQNLPSVLKALGDWLSNPSAQDNYLRGVIAAFADAIARWLKGEERLDALVNALGDAGLGTEVLDQLFSTFRVHVYYDTGERVTGANGVTKPVLSTQTSFGLHAYHEGAVEGWSAIIEGATRLAEDFYVLKVPENGTARVTTKIQAREPGEKPIPEPPIVMPPPPPNKGCWQVIKDLLTGKK